MSAPNFASTNTSVLYCIFPEDEWDYNDAKINARNNLKSKGWESFDEWDGDNYYCGHYFASKVEYIDIPEWYVKIITKAKIVSGYYEGGAFDYDVEIKFVSRGWGYDEDYCEDEITPENCIKENWYGNRGLSKIHSRHICDKINSIIQAMKDEAEEVFKMHCDQRLVCGGIFSNGEAVYYDADSERGKLKAKLV